MRLVLSTAYTVNDQTYDVFGLSTVFILSDQKYNVFGLISRLHIERPKI